MLRKVISGGQTGADRAGLEAAKVLGIQTGGTTMPGFMTSKGPDYALRDKFGLREVQSSNWLLTSQHLAIRTRKNVENSDGTIIFRTAASPGSDLTISLCQERNKPLLIIYDLRDFRYDENRNVIIDFIKANNIVTLNVAGHRNDKTAGMIGYQEAVQKVLVAALFWVREGAALPQFQL
jgi:hypothetical protein